MASPTRWTWVWVNSKSWWCTGKPGMLQSMGSQRAGHDWAAELTELKFANILLRVFFIDVHSRNWLFLVVLLSGFGIRVMKASLNEFGNISSPSILQKNLRRMGPNYSLNVWRITLWSHGVLYIRNQQNMAHEPVHSAIYFVNKFCWNIRKLIYLCIINNLFHETMAEFSSCNRMNGLQRQKYLLFYPLLKKFVIPSSTSLVIMEMQVNATMRSLYTH